MLGEAEFRMLPDKLARLHLIGFINLEMPPKGRMAWRCHRKKPPAGPIYIAFLSHDGRVCAARLAKQDCPKCLTPLNFRSGEQNGTQNGKADMGRISLNVR
jgi:hypothetical protein